MASVTLKGSEHVVKNPIVILPMELSGRKDKDKQGNPRIASYHLTLPKEVVNRLHLDLGDYLDVAIVTVKHKDEEANKLEQELTQPTLDIPPGIPEPSSEPKGPGEGEGVPKGERKRGPKWSPAKKAYHFRRLGKKHSRKRKKSSGKSGTTSRSGRRATKRG